MHAQRFGGSFAPPLSDAQMAVYAALIEQLPECALKDALRALYTCVEEWWAQPESTGEGRPHPSGRGVIVDLDESVRLALDPHVPWEEELDHHQRLCDAIPAGDRALRDCAFHLLWHARELCLDREPITADKL